MELEEMRELDEWIAAQLGWERVGDDWRRETRGRVEIAFSLPTFTKGPWYFAQVKREIERRGWGWESKFLSRYARTRPEICYCFTVFTENWETDGCVNASSEELAGCLAFKAAVEVEL